jgi:hypothetical protein
MRAVVMASVLQGTAVGEGLADPSAGNRASTREMPRAMKGADLPRTLTGQCRLPTQAAVGLQSLHQPDET